MPKPTQIRGIAPSFFPEIPENATQDIPLLATPKGMRPGLTMHLRDGDIAHRLANVHYESSGLLSTGLMLQYTYNVATVGVTILSVFSYRTESDRIIFAAATDGLYYLNTSSLTFTKMTGPTLSGLYAGDFFTFLPFGNVLLCTCPVVGMYEIDLTTFTYSQVTDAPQDAQFIELFNGCVVVTGSVAYPRRVQWSAKFSYTDWTGLGSGFEDLQPLNTLSVNAPIRVVPVDDRRALVFRQETCDLVSATDNFDAPFIFQQLHTGVDSRCPRAIANTRNGVVTVGSTNVFLVTIDSVQGIGTGLITTPMEASSVDALASQRVIDGTWIGKYNHVLNEYWLATQYTVFRYQFGFSSWVELTRDSVSDMTQDAGYSPEPYSALLGFYSGLTGTLGSTDIRYKAGMLVASGTYVYLYEPSYQGLAAGHSPVIETNDIDLVNRNRNFTVTHLQIAYQNQQNSIIITVLYSTDSGATYQPYGAAVTGAITLYGSELITMQKTVTARQIRFRIVTTATGKMVFHQFLLKGVQGSEQMVQQ